MQPQTNEPQKRIIDHTKWKPGKYRAKPLDWGVGETKEGLPQVTVLMVYTQPGDMPGTTEEKQLLWFGSFKDGAIDRTLESLSYLGLRGPVSAMELGRDGKALDETTEVEIVVEHREYLGVMRAGIRWINQLGGSRLKRTLEPAKVQMLFGAIDQRFAAYARQEGLAPRASAAPQSATRPAAAPAAAAQQPLLGTLSEEDIPF